MQIWHFSRIVFESTHDLYNLKFFVFFFLNKISHPSYFKLKTAQNIATKV